MEVDRIVLIGFRYQLVGTLQLVTQFVNEG